jgi:PKD repeat protein
LFGDICTIGFTNDGKKLIIASDNSSSISFWSISTGEFIYAKYFSSAYDWKFAFSKDTIQLTTGSSDGIIRVFDNSLHQELKASFTCDSITVCLGDTVKFHDSSPGRPTKWFWDFGDSSTSTLTDPVHVYPDLGFYSIKFIASNNKKSDTLFIKRLIRIKPRPTGMPDDQENSRIDFSVRPNPLDDNSVIHFYLDKPQPVQVKIFNQLGQEVSQIADGYFSAGSSTISFNPNDCRLMSGLYYIQLTAGPDLSVKEIFWQK